jgi:aconitate hydratase
MERYVFLKWGQKAFNNFRVVPPGTGICHQVNLEYLAQTVWTDTDQNGEMVAYPDTLVGTDSHTTMVNGLAVLGWGVGGIEAEAAMLGQPVSMLIPEVVGFKLTGTMMEGTTATDLVLKVVQMLRKHGVVNKFVEFYGDGWTACPGRPRHHRQHGPRIRRHLRLLPDRQRNPALPAHDRPRRIPHRAGGSLCQGQRHVARRKLRPDLHLHPAPRHGHHRPRHLRPEAPAGFPAADRRKASPSPRKWRPASSARWARGRGQGRSYTMSSGKVVIASITSCTNTSNPYVMIGAGLVARKARALGLNRKPWVKTSLAPGSQVVSANT